jgi:hypothetical protein
MSCEEGSAEIGAVFILFLLSALLGGAVLSASVIMKYFDRYSVYHHEGDRAVSLLHEITESLQPFKNEEYDYENSYLIQSLKTRYGTYNFEVEDV